ncbi:Inositol oxygenase 2 [Raphanus sativus]|nr:Inositol oxygenase 2 [Raphanus sativus]
MTVLVEHFASDSRIEEKKMKDERDEELLWDGGFVVPKSKEADGFDAPDINFLGHSFRDYENGASERQQSVEEFYRMQHIHQTFDFVKEMRKEYGKLNKMEMSIWECCELLNNVVDDSDPDLDEPQIQHLLQTAEAIRRDYPNEDWLHLTALIHDLGKVLLLPEFGGLPQWAVVGDTFPVGCAFDSANIHHKYFKENPDNNTQNTIRKMEYTVKDVDWTMFLCHGVMTTTCIWWLRRMAQLFLTLVSSLFDTIPFIVPLHKAGTYTHLMNGEDREDLKWLHVFNKYDLYSKSKVHVDVEQVKPYYISLINKYFPGKLKW